MPATIEDSLRGHFLRSIRRRVEAKKLADGMVRIPIDDARLLLEIVELLDSEVRELRVRPTTDGSDASYRLSFLNACEAMNQAHPGLLEQVGSLPKAVAAAARTQPSMPLMMEIWNDGYSHGCDANYSPFGDTAKGEPESLVETEVLRVLDAWGKSRKLSSDLAALGFPPVKRDEGSSGEAGCGKAVCLDANGRDMLAPDYDEAIR